MRKGLSFHPASAILMALCLQINWFRFMLTFICQKIDCFVNLTCLSIRLFGYVFSFYKLFLAHLRAAVSSTFGGRTVNANLVRKIK